jgi:hypothetical protein
MREILGDIDRWRTQKKRIAVARVVDIEGSCRADASKARLSPKH